MYAFAPRRDGETESFLSPSVSTTGERNASRSAEYAVRYVRPPTWTPLTVIPAGSFDGSFEIFCRRAGGGGGTVFWGAVFLGVVFCGVVLRGAVVSGDV